MRRRSRSRFIEYQGKRWVYRESAEAGYFKDDGPQAEGFYYWKFECDDLQLFIEKYEGDPFEVGISEKISPSRVRVFPVSVRQHSPRGRKDAAARIIFTMHPATG